VIVAVVAGAGSCTSALPPPLRTGSATAWTKPPGRKAMPVAAPISAVEAKECPSAVSACASGEAMNAAGV
jgi:hypothetical protein